MAVIGIDLGTTYSAAARCVNGQPEIISLEGKSTMPSVVSLQKSGKIAIGLAAKNNQPKAPTNTIIEVKRLMGENTKVRLGDKELTPQELSSLILARIKELAIDVLGEPITGAVISCPAYFKDPARAATKEAAELAGLKVLRIVNEPTAAAYAYGVRAGDDGSEKLFLVYDLGGGTFDVTVIKMAGGLLDVIGTGGDPKLGGGNFDDAIVDWMLGIIREKHPQYWATLNDDKLSALKLRLKSYAEQGKIGLCNNPAPDAAQDILISNVDQFQGRPIVFAEKLTRAKFEELIDPLLENSRRWVDEALKVPKEKHNYAIDNITAILLVGGSTRLPAVRAKLQQWFPATQVWGQERGINPDEIVAMGASLVAADADITGEEAGPGTVLVDVTGHTLSVEVRDDRSGRDVLSPIVAKETPIPCAAEYRFYSNGNFAEACTVKVYQGEGVEIDPAKVTMIGKFDIRIARIKDPTPLMIGLSLDADGILVAHAVDELSGQKVTCKIDYTDTAKLKPEEVERRRAELDALRKATLVQASNPLGDEPGAPAPGPGMAPAPAAAAFGAPASADPSVAMNPILRTLYQKALSSFLRVPADRQAALVSLVTEIEGAARSGDRQKLDAATPQLAALLQDVA